MTDKQRNDLKTKIQDEIAKLSVIHPYLIIQGATGMGKALAVIKCIAKSKSTKKWLICVPEIAQIENFKNEFIKFGYEKLLNEKIENVICYASLKNYENTSLNLALNECHSLSEVRFDIVTTIETDSIIADSATIPEDIFYRLMSLQKFHLYSLSLKEGVTLGILPAPQIFTIPVSIKSIKEKFEYKKYGKIVKGTAEEYYQVLSDQVIYWRNRYNREGVDWMQNKSLQAATQRKRFLGNLKTYQAKELINQFKQNNERFICFATDIKQSTAIAGSTKFTINSTKTSKTNLAIIDKFNKEETNEIYCVGMLISGMNLTNTQVGLVTQLDSGSNNQSLVISQICGRILRGKEPRLYILYIENTQDEKYLNNAINAIGKEFVV